MLNRSLAGISLPKHQLGSEDLVGCIKYNSSRKYILHLSILLDTAPITMVCMKDCTAVA